MGGNSNGKIHTSLNSFPRVYFRGESCFDRGILCMYVLLLWLERVIKVKEVGKFVAISYSNNNTKQEKAVKTKMYLLDMLEALVVD